MGFSKNEVNLRRLLAVAPQRQNQAKLIHYVLTLRKQLEQLVAETTPEGLPRMSEVKVKGFLGKIEALTAKSAAPQMRIFYAKQVRDLRSLLLLLSFVVMFLTLAAFPFLAFCYLPMLLFFFAVVSLVSGAFDSAMGSKHSPTRIIFLTDITAIASISCQDPQTVDGTMVEEIPSKTEERINVPYFPGLRKRSHLKVEEIIHGISETDSPTPKLDAMKQAHIEKHRNLQEILTDEMVGLAHQLRESSVMMNLSSQHMTKLVDSTERALDHSLASTGNANVQTMEICLQGSNTTCFTWLVICIMTSIFIAVVLLIRVT